MVTGIVFLFYFIYCGVIIAIVAYFLYLIRQNVQIAKEQLQVSKSNVEIQKETNKLLSQLIDQQKLT